MSAATQKNGAGIAGHSNLSSGSLRDDWSICEGKTSSRRAVDTGDSDLSGGGELAEADIPVDFSDALGRLRRANLTFIREISRCYGEKPLGSPIKKLVYRISDGSVAVIDENGGLITFCCELGEDQ